MACACRRRGIALVTVLCVLTLMATLGAALAVSMMLEGRSAEMQLEALKSDLLIAAGFDHAKSILAATQLARSQDQASLPRSVAVARLISQQVPSGPDAWVSVHDSSGALYGRYRIALEDEGAKVNVNTARLVTPSKGVGWDCGEVALPQALGVSRQIAERIIDYRYGGNRVPGARGDDDANNARLMADGIDNDADGTIDEEDEGIDDPLEYSPFAPRGDDRKFTSVDEVLSLLLHSGAPLPLSVQQTLVREVPRRVTIYSLDMPGSATLPDDEPSEINTVTARECRQRLRFANKLLPFEGSSRHLDELAANIVDYRDQNHVLSTVGAAYGVEAVCFNELLANDGSEGRYTSSGMYCHWGYGYFTKDTGADNPNFAIASASLFNEWIPLWNRTERWESVQANLNYMTYAGGTADGGNKTCEGAWDVELDGREARLLGPARIMSGAAFNYYAGSSAQRLGSEWHYARMERFKAYMRMRDDIGGPLASQRVHGNPGFPRQPPAYDNFGWPAGFFKNKYICFGLTPSNDVWVAKEHRNDRSYQSWPTAIKIVDSTSDGVLTLQKYPNIRANPSAGEVTRCIIFSWDVSRHLATCARDRVIRLTYQALEPRTYYLPVINHWGGSSAFKPQLGFAPYPDVWNDNREYPGESKRWTYGGEGGDAESVRTSGGGCVDVYVRSGNNLREGDAPSDGLYLKGITFLRPEVIELVNVGAHAVSLENWTLTFNTGSIANDIGRITDAYGYTRGGTHIANPRIAAHGYFYLVNNAMLFNTEFGSGQWDAWGGNARQSIPVWEIPTDSWGVQYRIDKVRDFSAEGDLNKLRVYVKNEHFRMNDQFRGETFELQDTRNAHGKKMAHGSRYIVSGSGRNWFEVDIDKGAWEAMHFDPQRGGVDTLMLLGMPARGGVVSMTLKNEYKQITSRTIEYSYLEQEPRDWYGRSVEKVDPTHYNWEIAQHPSMGGQPRDARNNASRRRGLARAAIKNGPFASVAEVRRVRTGRDYANVESGSGSGAGARAVAAIANTFANARIRLEAGDANSERSGDWRLAADQVQSVGVGTIVGADADWEANQWSGHTLRFLTGPLRGEAFPVTDNTRVSLNLRDTSLPQIQMPISSPGGKPLRPGAGDLFSLGPGYATPLCYARASNASGTWTWRRAVSVPGHYNLYIFGLSDSINTTEFLEENYNASLDVAVWNYTTKSFDTLCEREQFGKEDCLLAGRIQPAQISPGGDVKIQLVAHDVTDEQAAPGDENYDEMIRVQSRKSGYAWFNYAVLAPVPVVGRVNVNTASERLLTSLPGIDRELARAIYHGYDATGKPTLKPYRCAGDLLAVKGMTLATFESVVNLVMVDSSTYTVSVEAQAVIPGTEDADFSPASVSARQRKRFIVETAQDGGRLAGVHILEQTRL